MSLVSVIIPTFNQAQFICQTVDSVLAQTHSDFEVIVVDDGSSDDTRMVLARYDGEIKYIYQENKGPAAARNKGFLASRGEYILFLDSDDLIPPNKLELHISFLEIHPECGLAFSAWQKIDEDGNLVGDVRLNSRGDVVKEILRCGFFFFPSATVIRRECLERVGLFDESMRWSEDADLWLRIARTGYAFGYLDSPLLQKRAHRGSLSVNVDVSQVKAWVTCLDRFFADPDLPSDIRALEAEAYSVLHYETAARYYRAGRIEEGQDQLRQAILRYPAMDHQWLIDWLAGSALDAQTGNPRQLLDLILNNLPREATTLIPLRRCIYGRFHTAAAFSDYQSKRFQDVRKHILPALLGDPAIIRNRGFVSISLRSLFGLHHFRGG